MSEDYSLNYLPYTLGTWILSTIMFFFLILSIIDSNTAIYLIYVICIRYTLIANLDIISILNRDKGIMSYSKENYDVHKSMNGDISKTF